MTEKKDQRTEFMDSCKNSAQIKIILDLPGKFD